MRNKVTLRLLLFEVFIQSQSVRHPQLAGRSVPLRRIHTLHHDCCRIGSNIGQVHLESNVRGAKEMGSQGNSRTGSTWHQWWYCNAWAREWSSRGGGGVGVGGLHFLCFQGFLERNWLVGGWGWGGGHFVSEERSNPLLILLIVSILLKIWIFKALHW